MAYDSINCYFEGDLELSLFIDELGEINKEYKAIREKYNLLSEKIKNISQKTGITNFNGLFYSAEVRFYNKYDYPENINRLEKQIEDMTIKLEDLKKCSKKNRTVKISKNKTKCALYITSSANEIVNYI